MIELDRLRDENNRLRRSVEELSALAEIASAASQETSVRTLVETIVHKCVERLQVREAALYLLTTEDNAAPDADTLWREARSSAGQAPVKAGRQIVGWMLDRGRPLRINDLPGDGRFGDLASDGIGSLLAVPLKVKGELVAILTAFDKTGEAGFTPDDQRLLGIIASQTAGLLRNSQLIGELRSDRERLSAENRQLRREVRTRYAGGDVVGSSPKIAAVLELIERTKEADYEVLITGESGTGKELFAKTIHYSSRRADGPFVALNCAALPENLIEAELFGVEKGVATGVDARPGNFEAASGGTLFLDEIGELPLAAQAKILRALQEKTVRRVGGRKDIRIDARVIAATNRDLEREVQEGRFREDLFYRLNVIRLETAPLREMRGDIEELAETFLSGAAQELGRPQLRLSADAAARLAAFDWPGNVRQLQNEIKRAALRARGDRIEVDDLSPELRSVEAPGAEAGLANQVAEHERRLLLQALKENDYNQSETARRLGMSRQGLLKKLKRYGIKKPE